MAFVKLHSGILHSSLWVDRECRDMFVTALLMAEPHELREPAPQFGVRTLEPTGFVVQPGWYGLVQAAGSGIAAAARVEHDAGLSALERLGAPDPESRTSDHEGRRLVRIDGGYVVLNFMRYRDKDETGAERARRYRERKRIAEGGAPPAEPKQDDPSRVPHVTSRVTRHVSSLAEAEAEAEAWKSKTPPSDEGGESSGKPSDQRDDDPQPGLEGVPGAPAKIPACPHMRILALWAELLPEIDQPIAKEWAGTQRADDLQRRWRDACIKNKLHTQDRGLAYFAKLFRFVRHSKFLMGNAPPRPGGRAFRLTIAYLLKRSNWVKLLEGGYHDARTP